MENLINVALQQGLWAGVSVSLIFYILKQQEKRDARQEERENNYQRIIAKLTDKLNIVEKVREDVEEIKHRL